MKTKHGQAAKPRKTTARGPRITFCITAGLQRKIDALGRVEKRHMSEKYRRALDHLLNDWNSNNPQPNGKPLKITP